MAVLRKIPLAHSSGPVRRRHGCLCAFVLLLAIAGRLSSQPAPAQPYQIKAVFLFNFTQFVDWPPSAFPAPESPLVIGVLGENPFDNAIDEAVLGEKIGDRALVVRRYRRVEDVEACHVLFIGQSEKARLESIFGFLKGRSILTVSDSEGFARRGGMIEFLTEKSKIRLRINLEPAKIAGLTISSKLLRSAEIVTGERN